jgi:hypothetical protein
MPKESNAGVNLPQGPRFWEFFEFKGLAFCLINRGAKESACGISTYGLVDYVELHGNRVIF